MTNKDYQKPTIKVVELQHQAHMLQGSPPKTLQGKKGPAPEEDVWYEVD